jgi:hypothetical protein
MSRNKKKSKSTSVVRLTKVQIAKPEQPQRVNLESFSTTPMGTLSGQGYIQNPFSPQQDSIEASMENPCSNTSYVNTTNGEPNPQTIPSLAGTGNTSQLQIGQKMERLANKYNVELLAEN